MVVLDVGAGPVRMPWLDGAGAVLVPWYGGLQHGNALADVLYGVREPGGLPQTFPVDEAQHPFAPGVPRRERQGDPTKGLLVGYRWYDATGTTPLFPFGYGLGYVMASRTPGRPGRRRRPGQLRGAQHWTYRAGAVVPQLYLSAPARAGGPAQGVHQADAGAGGVRRVSLDLEPASRSRSGAPAGTGGRDAEELRHRDRHVLARPGAARTHRPLKATV